jgi:hypothetical protein
MYLKRTFFIGITFISIFTIYYIIIFTIAIEEKLLPPFNPFIDCLINSSVINIPEPHYSYHYHYAGFTSDMGWILMMGRYSIANNEYMAFPNHWGHSEKSEHNAGWMEMFEPITHSNCHTDNITYKHIDQHNAVIRQKIKFKDYYTNTINNSTLHPNKKIIEYMNDNTVNLTDDLTVMRQLFKWIFKLKPRIRKIVDGNLIKIDEKYVSMHIRWGDKIGESKNKKDPIEGHKVSLKKYVQRIPANYNVVFVSTDDIRAVDELRLLLPVTTSIITTSTGHGFSITDYKPTMSGTVKLWTEMKMMAAADIFITNMESNVAKMVHLMMENASQTIDVAYEFACCKHHRYNNCFWLCN